MIDSFKREIITCFSMFHENVVRALGFHYCLCSGAFFVVLEHVPGG